MGIKELKQDTSIKLKVLEKLWYDSIVGIALVSGEGRVLHCNSALSNLLGYTKLELQEKTFQEFTYEEDIYPDVSMVNRLVEGLDDDYVMQKRYITKTGQTVWALLKVSVIRDDEGNFIMLLAQIQELNCIDITNSLHDMLSKEVDKKESWWIRFLKFIGIK